MEFFKRKDKRFLLRQGGGPKTTVFKYNLVVTIGLVFFFHNVSCTIRIEKPKKPVVLNLRTESKQTGF